MSAGEVVTLGCRLNHAESARIAGLLGNGAATVVNTCAVTAEAVRDSRRAVRRAARTGPVIATGCAATIDPAGFGAIADAVVPNGRKLDLDGYVSPFSEPLSSPRKRGSIVDGQTRNGAPALDSRFRGNDTGVAEACPAAPLHTRAFVPVQTGCDHACTFCIIPQGRGPSVSRPLEAVIAEIAALVDEGVREVVLTGVDLTAYAPSLGALVAAILARTALPRLRLSSLDGPEIDPLLFELLTREPRVMPHVHLSLQSGDDLVLKRMKRRHTRRDAVLLVERLKAARPEIAIGADLIAGFPTEDARMHAANLSLVAACAIVHGHVFPYSPRPGTSAARMPQVAPATVRARAGELRAAIAGRRADWLTSLVGSRQQVLAERDGTGHAANFARFRLPAGTPAGTIIELTPRRVDQGLLA